MNYTDDNKTQEMTQAKDSGSFLVNSAVLKRFYRWFYVSTILVWKRNNLYKNRIERFKEQNV